MANSRPPQALLDLFAAKKVVDLPAIRATLGDVSHMTAFRHLRRVPYRRSYNHNGRFYALHEPSRYDRFGLWTWRDVHFSVDGSLRKTVRRLVHEAETGATHRELQDRLAVRVHNTLLDLLRHGEVDRERLAEVYVYLHTDAAVRQEQIRRRQEWITAARAAAAHPEVSDAIVIDVLLTLIRHPGSQPVDLARHLRGHAPPITFPQVQAVFTRYDLGEKGGPSKR